MASPPASTPAPTAMPVPPAAPAQAQQIVFEEFPAPFVNTPAPVVAVAPEAELLSTTPEVAEATTVTEPVREDPTPTVEPEGVSLAPGFSNPLPYATPEVSLPVEEPSAAVVTDPVASAAPAESPAVTEPSAPQQPEVGAIDYVQTNEGDVRSQPDAVLLGREPTAAAHSETSVVEDATPVALSEPAPAVLASATEAAPQSTQAQAPTPFPTAADADLTPAPFPEPVQLVADTAASTVQADPFPAVVSTEPNFPVPATAAVPEASVAPAPAPSLVESPVESTVEDVASLSSPAPAAAVSSTAHVNPAPVDDAPKARVRYAFEDDFDTDADEEAPSGQMTMANMWDQIAATGDPLIVSRNFKGWYEKLFIDAREFNTSDLHLETFTDGADNVVDLRVRARVDGKLIPFRRVLGEEAGNVIGVLKSNSAGLKSAGSKVQGSQITIPLGDGTQFETRATIGTKADDGEILNVRLPISGGIKPLRELGMAPDNLRRFRRIIGHPHGLVLIAGPTGSGKTTTIHSALNELLRPDRTIFTLEDPVERFIPGTVQIQVTSDDTAGKQSFSSMLPHMVRFDYDMLFLGEIRDVETAQTAIKQAQIGKMVFATIHANDNVVALQRLITLVEDEAGFVLDSVRGVVSQRLMAKKNPNWDGLDQMTRYAGRTPIHEVTSVTPEIIQGFIEKQKFSDLRSDIQRTQKSSLALDAVRLLEAGVTDFTEARRVLGDNFMEDLEL